MRAVVMKFGGSSVVDATAMRRVIRLVSAERERGTVPIVVVSALGGVTDRLLGLAELARKGESAAVESGVTQLLQRHLGEAGPLGVDAQDPSLVSALESQFAHLRSLLQAIEDTRAAEPRVLDAIAASGELLSSRIVAAAMTAAGLPAVWVDAREVVLTDDRHTSAGPRIDEIAAAAQDRLAPHVAAGSIAVLGGFIGRAPDGSTTTLGRGGSDYSAALVGAAIGAAEIQIWTDVDGMLTADPRVVNDAEVVPQLSFAEAAELAYFGAKVLHPSTIFPAVARNIPVRILNSQRPEAKGTLITADAPSTARSFAALACKRHITILDITSTRMLMAHGFLRRVFEVFDRYETAVDVVTTSEVSVSVTIDDSRRGPDIVAALLEFADVTVEEQMALLAVVGDRLTTHSALAARVVGALTSFPLRMVSQAASRRNVTIVLPEASLSAAMTHLHRELFAPVGLAEAAAGRVAGR
jgi:aspartate kinase